MLAPLAGTVAERLPRKLTLVGSDAGAALGTALLAILLASGTLALWHLYAVTAFMGVCRSLQWPAFNAAAVEMTTAQDAPRLAGLTQMAEAAAMLVPPLLGGILLASFSVETVLLTDLTLMLVANGVLLALPLARGRPATGSPWSLRALLQDAAVAAAFLRTSPGLKRALAFMLGMNFVTALGVAWIQPMILARADAVTLGAVMTVGAIGLLVGGAGYSLLGARLPLRFVAPVGTLVSAGGFCTVAWADGGLRFTLGYLSAMVGMSVTGATLHAAWLRAVPSDMIARVFSLRRVVTWSVIPLAYVLAAPLLERLALVANSDGYLPAFLMLAGARALLAVGALLRPLRDGR